MEAVFYDRKNMREVSSKELMLIKLVKVTLTIDSEERKHGVWKGNKSEPAYLNEEKVDDFGYKSNECPTYMNYDLTTSLNDLIFLRLE